MIIKKDLIKRKIAGDTVLVPAGKTVFDSNGLFVMNEVADFIWELLPDAAGADDICKKVLEEYDVTAEEAARDVEEFLEKLKEMDII